MEIESKSQLADARNEGLEIQKTPEAIGRERETKDSTRSRDDRAIEQKLANDAPTSCPQRSAEEDFVAARPGKGEKEVCDVGARGKQDQSDDGEYQGAD